MAAWEIDSSGNEMPVTGAIGDDDYWELDGSGDLQPVAA